MADAAWLMRAWLMLLGGGGQLALMPCSTLYLPPRGVSSAAQTWGWSIAVLKSIENLLSARPYRDHDCAAPEAQHYYIRLVVDR
jgi:hypothetical protein